MNQKRYIIVGGAAAGMTAATRIRRNCPDASVTVVEKGPHVSYAACGLPYYVSGDIDNLEKLILNTPQDIKQKYNIDVLTEHQALNIQPRQKILEVRKPKNGHITDLSYDRLILATGAKAQIPDIPGKNANGVFSLRNIVDAAKIKELLDSGVVKDAIIVGSGYLGLEMAEALRKNGARVLLVEAKPHIIDPFELDIASLVKDELLHNGCQMIKNTTVTAIKSAAGNVTSVELCNGSNVRADLVIFASGIKPNTELARQSGIEIGQSGAIRVNNRLQTSQPAIYAIGDCSEVRHIVSGKYMYFPTAPTALKEARIAADNASNRFRKFEGITATAIVKVFSLHIARTGVDKTMIEKLNLPVESVVVKSSSRAGYYPGSESITAKILFDKNSGRLLGAQLAGREGVSKRIDIFATALYNKNTVEDLLALDLSYTPPLSPAWDIVTLCAQQALKKIRK